MVVASDLEGTLTTGATWRGFGSYLKRHRSALRYNLFFYSRLFGIPLARFGIIDEQNYKNRWIVDLLSLFKGATESDVAHMSEWVVEHEMWPRRRQYVIDELLNFRREGHRVIVASGTYQPLAEAFARRLDAEGLGTPLEFAEGRLTGRVLGEVRVREGKRDQIHATLNGDRLIAAYGDTGSDIPMLEASECPIAVYPNKDLRAAAQSRGWRIVE
jgi:phosphoserine phosphatase